MTQQEFREMCESIKKMYKNYSLEMITGVGEHYSDNSKGPCS